MSDLPWWPLFIYSAPDTHVFMSLPVSPCCRMNVKSRKWWCLMYSERDCKDNMPVTRTVRTYLALSTQCHVTYSWPITVQLVRTGPIRGQRLWGDICVTMTVWNVKMTVLMVELSHCHISNTRSPPGTSDQRLYYHRITHHHIKYHIL